MATSVSADLDRSIPAQQNGPTSQSLNVNSAAELRAPGAVLSSVELLRANHPLFSYDSVELREVRPNRVALSYSYAIGEAHPFRHEIEIEGLGPVTDLNTLLPFALRLGLIEMLSYWKATCSPRIAIRAGEIGPEELPFWNNLLDHGMREFYLRNEIDFTKPGLVSIDSVSSGHKPLPQSLSTPSPLDGIVLASGGKDSVVTLEILRSSGLRFRPLLVNPSAAALRLIAAAGFTNSIIVQRSIDQRLLQLNSEGFLNGHVPFSASLAAIGTLCAYALSAPWVIVSNERSAEEGNTYFKGQPVNHQYSKSWRFEQSYQEYLSCFLAPQIRYFSLLRPLYEIQIIHEFAKHPRYFPLFRSCNRGERFDQWCGSCPKCLFTYLSLAPFIDANAVRNIFGRDLLEDETLTDLLRALLGIGDAAKPFECVGTFEEVRALAAAVIGLRSSAGAALPILLRTLPDEALAQAQPLSSFLTSWTAEHNIPQTLAQLVRQAATS